MSFDFAVAGNGWTRDVYYTNKGEYASFTMPGGGLLVARILAGQGISIAPAEVPQPEQIEHLSFACSGDGIFSVGIHAGVTKGNHFIKAQEAAVLIVYDESVSDFSPPENASILWACENKLPDQKLFEPVKERCFLMLSADALRNAGALISRQISWERTATDLVWQLKNNPKFDFLRGVPDILVMFAEDGAVHVRQDAGIWKVILTLTRGGFEDELREKSGRDIPDTWAVLVAGAATSWKARIDSATKGNCEIRVSDVLRPAAKLLESGYVPELIASGDFSKWLEIEPDSGTPFAYVVPISASQETADPDFWCISNAFQGSKVYDIAWNYVLEGAKVIDGIPRFSCGALTTVDRKEIEAFQNIRNLITSYAAGNASRPLSIAVFGSPGSGKSFGVTQIAKNVLPNVEKLEFNVSQFTSEDDLASAFHQVRDVILSGKLPLVFFDEFDSDRVGRALGWLKNFLMPMQDGKFKDASGEHPVGKCVMVFAGGTSSTFDDFCLPMNSEDSAVVSAFKNVKGPDFVSRLRGMIDVVGPNRASDTDQNFLLRRALLLRGLLERKLGVKAGRLPISKDVLHAMLNVPKYKHGARSMESILDMSRLGGESWEPASLPFHSQLSLHVDADAFIRLVLKEVVLSAYNETLAKTIHEDFLAMNIHKNYTEKQAERNSDSSYGEDWDSLPEEIKDSNRAQALSIPQKLLLVRCGFDAGDTPYQTLEEFTPDEILLLAQNEHIRWMEETTRNGWVCGPVRDNNAKIHPCLVEWNVLPPEEQQKDIDVANNIIPLLKKAGLRVYRMV
ncbi:MAG: AAA family ATPase [Deltaproteobacteria bacterium]|nr:AAA family ATPase [Deltaproteobacteria bacterium]